MKRFSRIKGSYLQRTNTERRKERLKVLYIFLFLLLFFISLFSLFFIFILRIRVVDLSYNIELGSLYIKLHLCLNLQGNWKYF